jgi:PAS domain S-box-containing protein
MRRHHAWAVVAGLLVIAGSVASVVAAEAVAHGAEQKSRAAFQGISADNASALRLAIQHEEDLVIHGAAFVGAYPNATNTEFIHWVKSVHTLERYPELESIGILAMVQPADLKKFAARIEADPPTPLKADGKFQLVPPGNRPFYCFASGSMARTPSTAAPGLDYCALTPTIVAGRDSGIASYVPYKIGNKVRLAIQNPIYRGSVLPATIKARRSAFVGFFGMTVIPAVVLDSALKGRANAAVKITYHADTEFAKLNGDTSFSSGTVPIHAQSARINLDNGWTVQTFGAAAPTGVFGVESAGSLLLGGLALSLLLGVLILVLATSRGRALALVDRQTGEIREQAHTIEQSERKFRSLVQNSSDLTMVCDSDGTLIYVSATSERVLGIAGSHLLGTPISAQLSPEDWAALATWLSRPAADMLVLTCCVGEAGGHPRWVEATATDLRADPAVGGVVLNMRDITDRQRMELNLRHTQKLETVGQLSAGIAHEINTPIQFIGDNVRFLQGAFGELTSSLDRYRGVESAADSDAALAAASSADADAAYLTEEVPTAIAETLAGVERVATIVKAMKVFGNPGTEAAALADLNEAIRVTLVVANSQLQEVAHVVTDLGELPPVLCHIGDINQVMLNLLINATYAIGEAAGAEGSLGTITIRTRTEADEIVIEITDTGCGMPADVAARAFDPFFTTKPVGVGTGQGLSIAHSLIHERHKGSITVVSQPGAGSTFTVRLPVEGTSSGKIRPREPGEPEPASLNG